MRVLLSSNYCTIFNISILFHFQCAEQTKLSWDKLKSCVQGDEGDNLLLHYGEITKKADVHYVPHIVFNDVLNRTLENKARGNFVAVACDLLIQKPSVCSQ